MSDVFIMSCPCGKHDFIFGEKPTSEVEVKCPECGEVIVYDPKGQEKLIRRMKVNASKTEQKQ